VTRNCLKCGKPAYVGQHHLPNLQCEFCDSTLRVKVLDKNYYYVCERCDRQWELASVLPHWTELFQYCGLAAPGDAIFT
jgi:DNA-directed RNA polymerase subunit RPC12/RpoP